MWEDHRGPGDGNAAKLTVSKYARRSRNYVLVSFGDGYRFSDDLHPAYDGLQPGELPFVQTDLVAKLNNKQKRREI